MFYSKKEKNSNLSVYISFSQFYEKAKIIKKIFLRGKNAGGRFILDFHCVKFF